MPKKKITASSKKQFDIITIFPDIFDSYFNESLFKRAQKNKLISITTHNLRRWTTDRHQTVDDKPYGGGVGLLFKIEPIYKALESLNMEHKAWNINNKKRKKVHSLGCLSPKPVNSFHNQ